MGSLGWDWKRRGTVMGWEVVVVIVIVEMTFVSFGD